MSITKKDIAEIMEIVETKLLSCDMMFDRFFVDELVKDLEEMRLRQTKHKRK